MGDVRDKSLVTPTWIGPVEYQRPRTPNPIKIRRISTIIAYPTSANRVNKMSRQQSKGVF